jgi:hypothetical protein
MIKNNVYIGVKVGKYGGVTVLIDDHIAFCDYVTDDILRIIETANHIDNTIKMIRSVNKSTNIYACVSGDDNKIIGRWQGVFADRSIIVIDEYKPWFEQMVIPHIKDMSLTNNQKSISVAQCLQPEHAHIMHYVGFADSFHIARLARALGLEIDDATLKINEGIGNERH